MGRRTVLMLVAILVAALGSTLVFLYVQGINDRAIEKQNPVKVLTATDTINPGESLDDAQAAGKLALTDIPEANVLPGALTSVSSLQGQLALTTIYKGEQLLPEKFGSTAPQSGSLTLPKGKVAVSVELSDYARVAGFVQPGSHVAIYVCVHPTKDTTNEFLKSYLDSLTCQGVQILLSNVEVLATGDTSLTTTTSTDTSGTQTTEQLPKTLLTLALSEQDSKRVVLADANGDLIFSLMSDDSGVKSAPPIWALSALK
jgi:pilus assembly protein CpaB